VVPVTPLVVSEQVVDVLQLAVKVPVLPGPFRVNRVAEAVDAEATKATPIAPNSKPRICLMVFLLRSWAQGGLLMGSM
jgi:hypothetical protein